MARLKAAEARITRGTVRYRSAGRSVKWDGDVDEAAGRRELARGGKEYGSSSSTLRFAGGAWREEGVFTSAAGVTTQSVFGASNGERRSVVSAASHVHGTLAADRPGPDVLVSPALRCRLADLLKDVPWKNSQAAPGGLVRLRGIWLGRTVTLTLDPARDFVPVDLRLETRRAAPQGAETLTAIQDVRITYRAGQAPPYPSRIEQLTVSRLGEGAHAVIQTIDVEEATMNGPLALETLEVALPKGAEVLDSRAGRAVYYAEGDRDVTLAEVTALAEKQAADTEPPPPKRPKLGAAAPALALKDLEGRPARLEDYRGKIVLLNWFASW